MYKKHLNLNEPEPWQRLWRYIKYDRLLQLINDGKLYFPHISCLDDKWEGLLTEKTRDKLFREHLEQYNNVEVANAATEQYEEFKNDYYINSWHMNIHESHLMWRVYGDRECAIQTTLERIKAAFHNTPAEINGCIINYIDYERESFPVGNTFTSVSHKDIPYEDEREFRLLYWKTSLLNQGLPVEANGMKIAVDVDLLIENLYINPTDHLQIGQLSEVIKNSSLSCEIKKWRIKE